MRQSSRDATESKRITAQLAIPAHLIVAPAALFYGCLFSHLINLPFYIRFARGEVSARRNIVYVEAARASGNTDLQIIAIHILPNIMPAMMVQISLNMGWAIMNAAALSFVGLGIRPPAPEWGIMVFEGAANIISGQWWTFIFPGAALMLAIACFDLLGEHLRQRMDPRSAR